ncbi:MAG: glycoside hydrolase domain-containing protein [Tepidisphaeraceae bacterium]
MLVVIALAPALSAAPGRLPDDVVVWNAEPVTPVGDKTIAELAKPPLGPVEVVAPVNGVASGQLVVSAGEAFAGPRAVVGDLKSTTGDVIPAGAVRVRYADVSKSYVPLLDRPLAEAKVHPIWFTVKIPRDAKPGRYTASVEIRGLEKPIAASLRLQVAPWRAPDPRDWRYWVNMLQSPESVAGYYKVPRWSDEHFRLMEKSIEAMGLLGNDILGVSVIGRNVFGDDPIILFRQAGGRFVPELKYLERYLDLYEKHCGPPKLLCVQVWTYGMYSKGYGRDGGAEERQAKSVLVHELKEDGSLAPLELPMYGDTGSEEIWRPVMDALRDLVKRRGWSEDCIILGTSGDSWPSAAQVAFFKKIAPYARWRSLTHGCGCPKWGTSALARTQPNGMVVGLLDVARRIPTNRPKVPGSPLLCNSRDHVGSGIATYRGLAAATSLPSYGYEGYSWKGLDYWTYTTPEGAQRNALNTYVVFGNMVGGTPRAILYPGPNGAVPTVQFEMLREGTQEFEAVLDIREKLDLVYPRPTKKYDSGEIYLDGAIVMRDGALRELSIPFYFDEGKIVVLRPTAPLFNTGRHSGTGRIVSGEGEEVFDFEISINDDRWVRGGEGKYTVRLKRHETAYTGTFTGRFANRDLKEPSKVQGSVIGAFRPGGHEVVVPSDQPRGELARRCDALFDELEKLYGTDSKAKAQGTDSRGLAGRIYQAAAEIAAAAATTR